MRVVDADAHVIEGPAAFEFLDPAFQAGRPVPLVFDEGWAGGMYARFNALWLIALVFGNSGCHRVGRRGRRERLGWHGAAPLAEPALG